MIIVSLQMADTYTLSFSKKNYSDISFNKYVSVSFDTATRSGEIVPLKSVKNLNAIDFNSSAGKNLALAILNAALYVAKDDKDADFKLYIISQENNFKIRITTHSCSVAPVSKNCEFCDKRQFNGPIIAENKAIIAFEKSNPPRTPINFLIIPKEHSENYKDTHFTPELFIEQLKMAQQLSKKLVIPTFDLIVNNGRNAGQGVFHSHMHFRSSSEWKL